MKNNNKKILIIVTVLVLLILPINTNAKTIKQFEDEVNKYTKELQEKKNLLAKNNEEVAQIKARIRNIEGEISQAEEEMKKLQEEIDASNKEIERKSEESKSIIEYYQVSNGNNAYLEYAFGATSITDMIYRLSVVEQLTEYNDKVTKELEALIKENNAKKEALAKKSKDLKELSKKLEREKMRIEADAASLQETMPSIEKQIKEAKKNVAYFKNLGCGKNEDIQACQYRIAQQSGESIKSVGYFVRPMQRGYVTQGYGGKYGHHGYDFSSYNKWEPIYPIADGIVHDIYYDNCTGGRWCQNAGYHCNGNAKIVVIKHNYNNRYIYSSYVHLSSFGNISKGQLVSKDTVIGYMGTTGCSSGPHLHIEIASCHWSNHGGCTYNGYLNRLINPSSLFNIPSRWNNR